MRTRMSQWEDEHRYRVYKKLLHQPHVSYRPHERSLSINSLSATVYPPLNDPNPAATISSVTPIMKPRVLPSPPTVTISKSESSKRADGHRFHQPQPTSGEVVRNATPRKEKPAKDKDNIRRSSKPSWRALKWQLWEDHCLEDTLA